MQFAFSCWWNQWRSTQRPVHEFISGFKQWRWMFEIARSGMSCIDMELQVKKLSFGHNRYWQGWKGWASRRWRCGTFTKTHSSAGGCCSCAIASGLSGFPDEEFVYTIFPAITARNRAVRVVLEIETKCYMFKVIKCADLRIIN